MPPVVRRFLFDRAPARPGSRFGGRFFVGEAEGLITGPPGGADRGSRGRRESSRLTDQVVLVALAILFGVIGFAVHFVWFGSIVLMAVLLGPDRLRDEESTWQKRHL